MNIDDYIAENMEFEGESQRAAIEQFFENIVTTVSTTSTLIELPEIAYKETTGGFLYDAAKNAIAQTHGGGERVFNEYIRWVDSMRHPSLLQRIKAWWKRCVKR